MYLPDCILAPRYCQALPPRGRLWPSDDDEDDNDGYADDGGGDDDDDDIVTKDGYGMAKKSEDFYRNNQIKIFGITWLSRLNTWWIYSS